VNGAPVCLRASQGRSDQVDHAFVPITSSMSFSIRQSSTRYWLEAEADV
jgi:hypothetical protein